MTAGGRSARAAASRRATASGSRSATAAQNASVTRSNARSPGRALVPVDDRRQAPIGDEQVAVVQVAVHDVVVHERIGLDRVADGDDAVEQARDSPAVRAKRRVQAEALARRQAAAQRADHEVPPRLGGGQIPRRPTLLLDDHEHVVDQLVVDELADLAFAPGKHDDDGVRQVGGDDDGRRRVAPGPQALEQRERGLHGRPVWAGGEHLQDAALFARPVHLVRADLPAGQRPDQRQRGSNPAASAVTAACGDTAAVWRPSSAASPASCSRSPSGLHPVPAGFARG